MRLSKMKIAIVGTGNNARNNYIPYLSKRKDVVLSYFERTPLVSEECAKNFGGRVAKSLEDLMADEPDSVLVLTDETQHLDVGNMLLEYHPKRLYFEKPLHARNGQANVCEKDFLEARELLSRAQAMGVEMSMMFNYRFFEQTLRLKEIITSKGLGRLRQASLFVHYACWSHCIDLLRLLGGRAAKISAIAGTEAYGDEKMKMRGVDIAGSFLLESGATGTILGSSCPDIFRAPLYTATFNFENGMVRLCDLDASMEIYMKGSNYVETRSLLAEKSRWNQYSASFEKAIAAYMESVSEGKAPPVPGMAGLEELQFEVALKRSASEGRQVDVQREFPLDGSTDTSGKI